MRSSRADQLLRLVIQVALVAAASACSSPQGGPVVAGTGGPRTPACVGDVSAAGESAEQLAEDLEARVRAGPFYQVLEQRSGEPERCTRDARDGTLGVAFLFAAGGSVAARVDPRIEFSEQRLLRPDLPASEAIPLLRAAEQDGFGAGGCGIRWEDPPDETSELGGGAVEEIFRGDLCNCQGRAVRRGAVLEALTFRSAC